MWVNKISRGRLASLSVLFFLVGFFTSQPQFPPAWVFKQLGAVEQLQTVNDIVAYAEANKIKPDHQLKDVLNTLPQQAGLSRSEQLEAYLRVRSKVSESVRALIAQMDAELVPGDSRFQSLVSQFERQEQALH
jgi:hypothetical protein